MINLFGPTSALSSLSFQRNRALNRDVLQGSMVNKYDGRSTRRRIERDMRKAAKKAGAK